ncbi:WW domain binding 11 [Babesia ovata]|uniref:WW domain binding 11 n=1 Tax=Babesia ovata TaxID=189622 RepID=A0A2H6K9G2_9APIC|nr:WW domain binding 11 [Babesia ovata]GBE59618.1 WW domain binding 11 [Babesia ovata]
MPNPVEAYRKLQKKREKEKHRKDRQEAREAAKLVQDPDRLKKELDELSHKSIIGRIDDTASERKAKLEKLWAKHETTIAASAQNISPPSESSDKSSSDASSSEDDSDSDEDKPKCVIEIAGGAVISPNPKRKVKKEKLPDDFALELLQNAPPLPPKEDSTSQAAAQNKRGATFAQRDMHVNHAKRRLEVNPPKYIDVNRGMNHAAAPPPPPPPPPSAPPKKPIAIQIPPKVETPKAAPPLSSYFVPNQLRVKRN